MPQHIGVCAAGIDVHTGVIQVQLASPGRDQVQKWQHTPVMCLHMDNDSSGHFYVGDGSICFIRQILFTEVSCFWHFHCKSILQREDPGHEERQQERRCVNKGPTLARAHLTVPETTWLLWLTASAERSLCHSVFKHSIQACDLKNPNLGLNINPHVKSLQ